MGKGIASGYEHFEITICSTCFHRDVCGDKDYLTVNECSVFVDKDRCVVLPCKVGDVVYSTSPNQDKVIACYVPSLHTIARWIEDGVFGKTVFLTREEAEAALAKEGETP